MTRPVRRRAGALRHSLAVFDSVPAKRSLVDAAVLSSRERHTKVLELEHGRDRMAAHILDGVLIAEPIRPLDGVMNVPAPVVLSEIAGRGADATLRCNRMTSGGEDLRDACRLESRAGHAECRTKTGATGTNDDDIVLMIDDRIGLHGTPARTPDRVCIPLSMRMQQRAKVH